MHREQANREQASKINQKPEKDVSKRKRKRKRKSKSKSKSKSKRKSKSKQRKREHAPARANEAIRTVSSAKKNKCHKRRVPKQSCREKRST